MKPHIVGAIFARGGSKGVPRKNIRLLAGKPLIGYAIETARQISSLDRIVVSTDDAEIAEIARNFGAEVPFLRPLELAKDSTPEWLAWQHLIQELNKKNPECPVDILVSIPTTSPLRDASDVKACLHILLEGDAQVAITVTPTERNPYFNMVVLKDGYARVAISPTQRIYRRQDAPPVFDMTTVAYAARAEFVLKANSLFEGRVKAVVVPPERALDIDTELDLQWAEFLLTQSLRRV